MHLEFSDRYYISKRTVQQLLKHSVQSLCFSEWNQRHRQKFQNFSLDVLRLSYRICNACNLSFTKAEYNRKNNFTLGTTERKQHRPLHCQYWKVVRRSVWQGIHLRRWCRLHPDCRRNEFHGKRTECRYCRTNGRI
jgi:hypothetical protein